MGNEEHSKNVMSNNETCIAVLLTMPIHSWLLRAFVHSCPTGAVRSDAVPTADVHRLLAHAAES